MASAAVSLQLAELLPNLVAVPKACMDSALEVCSDWKALVLVQMLFEPKAFACM